MISIGASTPIRLDGTTRKLRHLQIPTTPATAPFGNPDFSEKGGGAGGPPPQEKVKLAKYGFRFATAFDNLLRQGRNSEINLYRSTGLKPKYQRAYFDYAKSITASELQTLELDDE